MPRPTSDRKGNTIILRINDETRKYLAEKAKDKTLSEYVRKIILEEKDRENNVIQKETPDYVKRVNVYGAPYGLSGEELAEKLMDAMDSGKIIYENGEFRAEEEFELSKFKDACQSKGVPIQKMIDKCTQMIWGM